MTLYNFELDKMVSLRDVYEAVEAEAKLDYGTHEIDLGDAGWHTIDCDAEANVDVEAIIRRLL